MADFTVREEESALGKQALGKDIKFENGVLVIDETGDFAVTEGRDCLRDNLRDMIFSPTHERVREWTWGANLEAYIGEHMDEAKKAELEAQLTEYLYRDTRVAEVLDIEIEVDNATRQCEIRVVVEPSDGSGPLNLVFPFPLEA